MTVRLGIWLQEIDIPEANYNSDFCREVIDVVDQALSDYNEKHKREVGEYKFRYTFFNATPTPPHSLESTPKRDENGE